MTQELKVGWDEVESLIKKTYKVKSFVLMKKRGYEADSRVYDDPDYILGKIDDL